VESTLTRVGPTTPKHSRILPDWIGYRASNVSSTIEGAGFGEELLNWQPPEAFFLLTCQRKASFRLD